MSDFMSTLKGLKSGESQAESGSAGGGNIKALKLTIAMVEVEKSLRLIHLKTGADNLELAMDLIWHKQLTRDESASVGLIVTILRCSLQGDVFPDDYSAHSHYKSIITGGKPSNDGLSSGMNL